MNLPMCRLLAGMLAVAALVAMDANAAARAETSFFEDFEGPQPTWKIAGGNAPHRIELHQRIQQNAHAGESCEYVRLLADNGSTVYLGRDIGRARVIDELRANLWVKSDRPGLQILFRVVLPRTKDPRTGAPLTALVGGSSYTQVGTWQQLGVEGAPQQLARQARVLRLEFGPQVDSGEAYVDRVLLNVYGGPGRTSVWLDDFQVAGVVGSLPDTADSGVERASMPPVARAARTGAEQPAASVGRRIEFVCAVLVVDGRPMFPRIIQHQGEPLRFLQGLGFNAVKLSQPPTPELLDEAARLKLWLVCPPPRLAEPGAAGPPATIGPEYDAVLAWDLGRELSAVEVESARSWADRIRQADRSMGRLLVCEPQSELRAYSRIADTLVIGRLPLGTNLELADYATWVRQRARFALPGTPIWTTIQTQPSRAIEEQWAALAGGRLPVVTVQDEQIRLLASTMLAAGSRGFLFESHARLDAPDPAARQRAMTLELVNLELELVDRWAAAGNLLAEIPGSDAAVKAAVLRTDHARLLLPLWSAAGAQFVPGQSAGNDIALVVPGVPEEYDVYEITPAGFRTVRHKRGTGGTRLAIGEFALTTTILLTQDPLALDFLSRRLAQIGRRAAELQRELAAGRLSNAETTDRELTRLGQPAPEAAKWLALARKNLAECDAHLAAGNPQASYLEACRAMRPLRMLERAHWDAAAVSLGSPLASPYAVSFATLPRHWELVNTLRTTRPGANRLSGGDFEDLERMIQAGWRHLQSSRPDVLATADLAPDRPHAGRFSLRLLARPSGATPPDALETAPVWVASPAVPIEAGQLVRIHGWVQVPAPIQGSVDGVMILDSFGGEALAERIDGPTPWREFTLYRAAPYAGPLTVTFVLSGLGEVRLDDVTIESVP
ncbi:MAG: hypothetical protein ACYC35_07035 [Pirellulales bacterium]